MCDKVALCTMIVFSFIVFTGQYPGRITDVQKCHCVAYYDLDDARIDAIMSELPEEEAEE